MSEMGDDRRREGATDSGERLGDMGSTTPPHPMADPTPEPPVTAGEEPIGGGATSAGEQLTGGGTAGGPAGTPALDLPDEPNPDLPVTPREHAEADALAEQRAEAEGFTIGPGVAGTKSQVRGGLAGLILGIVVGAVLGWIVGAIIGGTAVTVICIIVGAVAGATAGGVAGGFLHPRQKLQGGEADT